MDKNVLIHVKGIQVVDKRDEEVPIEIIVPGEYYYRNGSHYLKYEELMEDFQEPTINYVKISEKGVEVRKKGLVNVHMVFEPGKKNLTYYSTPFGTLPMGISATNIEFEMKENVMDVVVEYLLDMDEQQVAECYLSIHADNSRSQNFQI